MKDLNDLLTTFEEIHENTEEIPGLKDLLEEILDRVVGNDPELNRLQVRVDELLASNTALVLENRELKAEIARLKNSDIQQMGTIEDDHA